MTMVRLTVVVMFGVVTACSADHRETPDAAPECLSAGTVTGSGIDARGDMRVVDLSTATVTYVAGKLRFTDPTHIKLTGDGFTLDTHCSSSSSCEPTEPGSYGVGWYACWDNAFLTCHPVISGEGEFLRYDRLDASCVVGSFHLVATAPSIGTGDFTGTFSIRL